MVASRHLRGCSDVDFVEGQGAWVRTTVGHDVSILVVPVWRGHMRVKKVSRFDPTSSPASPGSDNYHRECSNMARTAVVARRANPTSRRKEIPSRTATYDAASFPGRTLALSLPHPGQGVTQMPRIARIAFSLAGLVLLYMVNPGVAWLMIGGGLLYHAGLRIYHAGLRRRRPLRSVSVS
jgi:hypothetical protein